MGLLAGQLEDTDSRVLGARPVLRVEYASSSASGTDLGGCTARPWATNLELRELQSTYGQKWRQHGIYRYFTDPPAASTDDTPTDLDEIARAAELVPYLPTDRERELVQKAEQRTEMLAGRVAPPSL